MPVSDWADMDDNRIGPILRELAAAIEDTRDDETLRRVQNRLKFMSGSVATHRHVIRSQSGKPGADNGG
jgi:hypothetical protein